jgi:Tfp pilus assembly protein PilN
MPVGALNQVQRVLLVACGKVDAGVDLAKLNPPDIITTGDKVTIRLPQAEIFTSQLFDDRKCTYVVLREEGVLLPPNTVLETAAREAAAANFDGTSQRHSGTGPAQCRRRVTPLLTLLGYRDIQLQVAVKRNA